MGPDRCRAPRGRPGPRPEGLRRGALAILALTAKVFLYDLAALDSLARVGSLIGLGVLLLAGGFAWQRIRPLPLPDLREVAAR